MVGLPCSGKSTVARQLHELTHLTTFCEPEESSWAECVTYREQTGRFGAHTWFRSIRTCQLYQAQELARNGQTVIVDSYLDKLLYFCLGKPGMEWLLPSDDPYFEVASHMARIDLETLPVADYLIFFHTDLPSWHKLLQTRSRKIEEGLFSDTVFYMQEYLRLGIEFLKAKYGVKIITVTNQFSNPKQAAEKLFDQLHCDTTLFFQQRKDQ
jgi:deoxyadenosine/deoxycytidine kinase